MSVEGEETLKMEDEGYTSIDESDTEDEEIENPENKGLNKIKDESSDNKEKLKSNNNIDNKVEELDDSEIELDGHMESTIKTDDEESDDEPEKFDIDKIDVKYNDKSLIMRKSFRFCMWLNYYYDENEKIETFTEYLSEALSMLLNLEEFELYFIYNKEEKDRIRVFCPDVIVDTETIMDIRNLILKGLKYNKKSSVIPNLIYKLPVSPNIFVANIWDMGLGKFENKKTYFCLNKELKTEELEKLMEYWSMDERLDLTPFSEQYIKFLEVKSEIEDDDDFSINDKDTSEQTKKDLGKNYQNCIDWFRKFHPDVSLNKVISLDNSVYLFDFSKSKKKCQLCNLVHKSNRQFLTFSNFSKKARYKCHDTDASDKSKEISFKNSLSATTHSI